MIDPTNVAEVSANELLARYILLKSHIRGDHSIKPNVFMPPPNLELSVTRHLLASEEELWSEGYRVAGARRLNLYGRGDISTANFLARSLTVRRAPLLPHNPNHAVVCDWPEDKPTQKNIAQEIAASAKYVAKP